MWEQLSEPWQVSFEQAWEAYCAGSVPIGAALADASGRVIGRGRSMQFEHVGEPGQIVWSKLSHAEVNALLAVSAHDHPDIRGCTLYTTMEPCPLCVGALVMSNVRSLRYAARDGWAGSVELLTASRFNDGKGIRAEGPHDKLETPAALFHTAFMLNSGSGPHAEELLATWAADCPEGVRLGKLWHAEGKLEQAKLQNRSVGSILDEIESLMQTAT